jgi:cyclic beta-1,2-glucan synthetase
MSRLDSVFFGGPRGAKVAWERPFRDELLSVERLDERARALAARFTIDPSRRPARSVFPRFDGSCERPTGPSPTTSAAATS